MTTLEPNATESGTFDIGGDLIVNRLGYGAMRITGEGIWGPPRDRAEAIRVLRRAVELGINFIDTADSYGPYISEELIAEALHPYPDGLVIATKGGLLRTGPNQWPVDSSARHLREALDGSLRRLKVDRIDLYQLHRIDPKVPLEETIGFLQEAKEAGKIRHVGLSEVSVDQAEKVDTMIDFVTIQNRYNLYDREWEDVLKWSETKGIGFIPWYPLSAGSIGQQQALQAVAQRHGATEYQVALAWLLAHSPNMLLIPGTSSVKHLEENTAAASLKLSTADVQELVEA
jgi:aryl-alcohol dehydrogenase-like predicted oxidoreductase